METTKVKKEKTFDAVMMMREARELIGAETKNMNAEQLKAYIKKRLALGKLQPIGR